jgi:hypothetical protein
MAINLKRYIEWMSRGRLTGRTAYTLDPCKLPDPLPGSEWQLDHNFNVAEALLERPHLKPTIQEAVNKGVAILDERSIGRGPA